LAHAFGRHLVRQQAHGTPCTQGFDHLAHARQVGGRSLQPLAATCFIHHLRQTGLVRRPEQNGQCAEAGAEALRQRLRGDLKATQMRC